MEPQSHGGLPLVVSTLAPAPDTRATGRPDGQVRVLSREDDATLVFQSLCHHPPHLCGYHSEHRHHSTCFQLINSSTHQSLSSGQLPYEIRPIPNLLPSLQIKKQVYPGAQSQGGGELGLEPRQ